MTMKLFFEWVSKATHPSVCLIPPFASFYSTLLSHHFLATKCFWLFFFREKSFKVLNRIVICRSSYKIIYSQKNQSNWTNLKNCSKPVIPIVLLFLFNCTMDLSQRYKMIAAASVIFYLSYHPTVSLLITFFIIFSSQSRRAVAQASDDPQGSAGITGENDCHTGWKLWRQMVRRGWSLHRCWLVVLSCCNAGAAP